MNIKIVGLGGIGSILSEKLSRFLNFYTAEQIKITLIDGDLYELKNLERQEFSNFGNKALVKQGELSERFSDIIFESQPYFVDEQTVEKLIAEGDVVFVAVDNHKARMIISNFARTLDNILIISGGNELTDGNVQIYARKEGIDQTPDLTMFHPEIANPIDKLPSEMTCEELSKSEPQLFFVNLGVATIMCWAFYNAIIRRDIRYSEVYFDLPQMSADSKIRSPLTN